ncbi:RHS domain-containing protein, partial [Tenacibaculum finnmarkense]
MLADHLGTPTSMYNEEGETTWVRSLDSNGKVREGD